MANMHTSHNIANYVYNFDIFITWIIKDNADDKSMNYISVYLSTLSTQRKSQRDGQ